jgi:site-specific DNA recombinase
LSWETAQSGVTVAVSAGWELVEVIDENDTSAFRQRSVALSDGRQVRRTVRPGFDRLLAGLRQRRFILIST